jgi:hypothetical protein
MSTQEFKVLHEVGQPANTNKVESLYVNDLYEVGQELIG